MRAKRSPFSTYNTLREVSRDPGAQSVYNEFARRLQAQLQRHGWNQSELARRCTALLPKAEKGQKQNLDFGRDRISRYVRGLTLPRPESLPTLAKALGVEADELLPPMGVPAAGVVPPFEMRALDSERVFLQINRTVSIDTATKIIDLLRKEDR